MITPIRAALAAASVILFLFAPAVHPASDNASEIAAEANASFIFVFRPDISSSHIPAIANEIAQQHGVALRHVYTTAIKGFSATAPDQVAARIAQNPNILYYERNGVVMAIAQPVSAQGKPQTGYQPPQVIPAGVVRVGGRWMAVAAMPG